MSNIFCNEKKNILRRNLLKDFDDVLDCTNISFWHFNKILN